MNSCWLHVTSGHGPDECCWVVARVVEAIIADASAAGYDCQAIEFVQGGRAGLFKSVLLSVLGNDLPAFAARWEGSIQWIGKSQFRPGHKRKNWFVGVSVQMVTDTPVSDGGEIRFECMRASGPGGQHTNKTESAIRAIHVPTGISVIAREERSQHMNKKLAIFRLNEKLAEQKSDKEKQLDRERWTEHNSLERGNPIRIYEGVSFRLRK